MAFSQYSGHIPRCQHIKTNGTQCGSPALRRKRFCYFHNRWRATHIDLNRAGALGIITTVELPVLEDADSIQVALMQVLRLILCRQLDSKTGGLMLYGLQTASSNLHHIDFEHRHKSDVIIDPRTVSETGVGDEAWSPEDFEEQEEEEDSPAAESDADHDADRVVKGDSPATADSVSEPESNSQTVPPPPEPAARSTQNEAAERPKNAAQGPSPGTNPPNEQAPERQNARTKRSPNQPEELEDLQRVQAALQGARRGNWRDLKTVFEFAGIYPPKDDKPSGRKTDDPSATARKAPPKQSLDGPPSGELAPPISP